MTIARWTKARWRELVCAVVGHEWEMRCAEGLQGKWIINECQRCRARTSLPPPEHANCRCVSSPINKRRKR